MLHSRSNKVHTIAVGVAEDLNFDVAGFGDKPFQKDGAIAECAGGLAHGALCFAAQLGRVVHDAHAFSTAASAGLDHDGKTDFSGQALRFIEVRYFAIGAGHERDVLCCHRRFGRELVAHGLDAIRDGDQ